MPSESPLFTSKQEQLLNALRESELLRDLSELLASSLDLTHILQILVRRTAEVCEVERCAVWLLNETSTEFLPSAYHLSAKHLKSKDVEVADNVWHRSSLPFDAPIIHHLLQANGMIALDELNTETLIHNLAEKFLLRSILLVALVREGRTVGMMSLDNPGKLSTFTPEQLQLARAIGQQAAIAIDNARLYQQAQTEKKRAERLTAQAQSIYKVAMAVNSGEGLSTVLKIATQHLIQGMDADSCAITLLEADTLSVASTTRPLPHIIHPTLADLPQCYTAALKGTPLFVMVGQAEEIEKNWYHQMGLDHVVIVPLMVGAQSRSRRIATIAASSKNTHCVGFVFVNYHQPLYRPSQEQYEFARDIATQCALAIEKAHILAEARRAAALATERANTLDAIFNTMTEGIIVLDQDGRVIISNNTASHFLGKSTITRRQLTKLLKRYPTYTVRGRQIPLSDFPLTRALRGEHIRGERFVTKRADNSERTVEVNIEPLFDSEARQIGLVSAFRDITEQVRVEQRIRLALDTMIHAVEVISGITDIKEILHRVLTMTLTALNCEYGVVQLYDQNQQIFLPLLSLGFSAQDEAQWLEEQKSWLAPTVDHSTGIRTQLLEGHAILINAEQYPEHPDPLRHTMILAAPIIHNKQVFGVMMLDRSPTLKSEKQQPGVPHSVKKRDFNIWDMAVAEGIAQFAGLAIEQTHWQQEAEIARTNEATMRESNALKDEFLAITAHEFRTPLTVILAHSQLMARRLRRLTDIDPETQEKLHESTATIEEQTHQLTNIVNTFLEVTLLNRGQIELVMEEVNLEEIIKQVVANHDATSTIHQICCNIESTQHPYLIQGDSARLLQIFTNLVQNAIKYSFPTDPITISLAQQINDEGYLMIEVCIADKGIGVPLEAQAHLFERFYRAPNIESSKTGGVGLGLYVVAEFLRLHQGTIRVESRGIAGEGSSFICTLPLSERNVMTDE